MTLSDPRSVSQGHISHWPRYGARATSCVLSFGFLVLTALLAGCASGDQMMVGQGQSVHTFRISYNNSHALVAGDRTILVDTGLEGDASKLLQRLEDAGITLPSIAAVIVTHGHADHAGGAAVLRRRTHATVYAGESEKALLSSGRNDQLCPTNARARNDLEEHQTSTYRGFEADVWISAQTSLKASTGINAHVVPLPGHTQGSLVMVADEWAFVGDLFRGAIVGSSAETHFYMCDLDDNVADIEWLLAQYPRVKTFLTGHFGPVSRESVVELLEERRAR